MTEQTPPRRTVRKKRRSEKPALETDKSSSEPASLSKSVKPNSNPQEVVSPNVGECASLHKVAFLTSILLIFVFLGLVVFLPILPQLSQLIFPCASVESIALTLTIPVLFFLQLLMHLIPGIKFKNFPIELPAIGPEYDPFRLCKPSNLIFWSALTTLLTLGYLLGVGPLSRFPSYSSPPVIKSFSASYIGGETIPINSDNVIEIERNRQVRLKATLYEAKDVQCNWIPFKGSLNLTDECSAVYSAPLTGQVDVISIQAYPRSCSSLQMLSGVHIKVLP